MMNKYWKMILSTALSVLLVLNGGIMHVSAEETVTTDYNREAVMEEKEEITYAPNVIKEPLENITNYTIDENSENEYHVILPSTDETQELVEGDHIILPEKETDQSITALTVISAEENTDGSVSLLCKNPESALDFIQSIDVSGTAQIETDQATSALPSVQARGIEVSGGSQIIDAGKITYQFHNTKLGKHISLNGSLGIEISKVEYRLKMDMGFSGIQVEDLYLSVDSNVSASSSLTMDFKQAGESGRLKLGNVPFRMGNSGLGGEIIFWLTYRADGSVSVSYQLENTTGIESVSGELQTFADSNSSLDISADSNFAFGPQFQFIIYIAGYTKLLDVTTDLGIAGKAETSVQGNPSLQGQYDFDCYVYLNMFAGKDCLIGKLLELKKNVIWDYDSSPFHTVVNGQIPF